MTKILAVQGCTLEVDYSLSKWVQTCTFRFPAITYKVVELDTPAWTYQKDEYLSESIKVSTEKIDKVSVSVSDEIIFKSAPGEAEYIVRDALLTEVRRLKLPNPVKEEIANRITKYFEQLLIKSYPAVHDNTLPGQARNLPGIKSKVNLPCHCFSISMYLNDAIIHLNDRERWTREQIADWLDELADKGEVDIDFPTPDEVDFDREAVNKSKEEE